jgi:S1-C subfamily serine protease
MPLTRGFQRDWSGIHHFNHSIFATMHMSPRAFARPFVLLAACALALPAFAASELARTIAAVKPSVVGVGTFLQTRSPATAFNGTGFVVGDGLSVITNSHVVPELLDSEKRETLGVVISRGGQIEFRPAVLAGRDRAHDLAHLRISGAPLPALALGDSDSAAEGQELAFTGYPLGMILGHLPARRHRLSGQQRQSGVRPGQRHGAGGDQHDVREGVEGKRDQPAERHRVRDPGQICS